MQIQTLIPKDKYDIETAEKLKNYSYAELEPIIPELMTWIQDMNWPVAEPVAKYLESISTNLTEEIIKILKGNDEDWKYWCLLLFGNAKEPIDPKLWNEIKRITVTPTKGEVDGGVQEIANEIINRKK